jgi:glycine betaine catabolism A
MFWCSPAVRQEEDAAHVFAARAAWPEGGAPMADPTHVGMNFRTDLPALDTAPLPVRPYVDAEQFEQERERIFQRVWLRIGRSAEVPNAGDFKVYDVPTWKASVIVARDAGGTAHAFLNICRHRGMVLTRDPCGNAGGFVCDYHGWTYSLDGTLRAIPGEAYFPGTDKRSLGARMLACTEWRGSVFVNWDAHPPWTLEEYLGELGAFVGQHPFEMYAHTGRYTLDVHANWKVVTDAFLEPYHVHRVHRRSLPDSMNAPDNPMGLPNSCRVYGHHRTMAVWANPGHVPTPAEALMWKHAFALQPGKVDEIPGANPDRSPTWWFDTNIFFPYFSIFIGTGWILTYDVWPVSVNRTLWEVNMYSPRPHNAVGVLGAEYTRIMLRDALHEDFSTVEAVQRNLETGALTHLHIAPEMEFFVRHQQWAVRQWLDGEPRPCP